MSDTVTAYYKLDISDVEAKAQQLRATLGGVEQKVAADSQASAAAMSRQALATGDVTEALRQMDAALGQSNTDARQGTEASLAMARAEATAAAAVGDHASAINILQAELAQQTERTRGVVAAEAQLNALSIREADTAIRVAQAQARAAVSTKDYAGALQILNRAKAQNADGSALAVASLEAQVVQTEAAGTVSGAFARELGGLVSPLALVTVGVGAAVGAFRSFGDALQFAGNLQEERTAFGGILGDFRLGNQVLDSAIARTRAYGFTAEETTNAFRELAPVIRESTSSVADQSDALIRISTLKPEDPVRALVSAIEGIKTGRFRELAKELGLSADEQKRLKDDVDGGKDAFVALNDVLDKHGITLDVAKTRMDGYAGATRRAEQAQEDLKKAQAKFAEGPGTVVTNQSTKVLNDLTSAFNGSLIGLNSTIGDTVGTFNPFLGVITAYNNAVLGAGRNALVWTGVIKDSTAAQDASTPAILRSADADDRVAVAIGGVIDAEDRRVQQINRVHQADTDATRDMLNGLNRTAQASSVSAAAQDAQQAKTALVTAQNNAAADAFLRMNPRIDEAGVLALIAAGKISAIVGQISLMRIEAVNAANDLNKIAVDANIAANRTFRPSGREGGSDRQSDADAFNNTLIQQNKEQASLLDSEIALAGAKKNTARQIDLLREKQRLLNFENLTPAEKQAQSNAIEAQIISIQTAGGKKRVDAAASTALQLQNTEENNQLALARIQREGLERLRDQEQDFNLKRARSQEDEDRKIRDLLAHGRRAEAAKEKEEFALRQKRDQEDFDIQRQRTLRNNREQAGDQDTRTDLRQSQIGARAALRGVRTNGDVAQPSGAGGGITTTGGGGAARTIQVQMPSAIFSPDGQKLGDVVYQRVVQLLDDDLTIEILSTPPPGGNQIAVAGPRA